MEKEAKQMPTKPKKKKVISIPMPRKRKLPAGLKGVKIDEIWAKGKVIWKDDPDIDAFLELVRTSKRD